MEQYHLEERKHKRQIANTNNKNNGFPNTLLVRLELWYVNNAHLKFQDTRGPKPLAQKGDKNDDSPDPYSISAGLSYVKNVFMASDLNLLLWNFKVPRAPSTLGKFQKQVGKTTILPTHIRFPSSFHG